MDAERFGVRKPVSILGEVADAILSFDQFAQEASFPARKRNGVQKHLLAL